MLEDIQVIFDGLDEVNPSKRSWLDREIKEFVTLYNENRYVLSSSRLRNL